MSREDGAYGSQRIPLKSRQIIRRTESQSQTLEGVQTEQVKHISTGNGPCIC